MQIKKKVLASVITASVAAAAMTSMSAFAQSADANLRGKATPSASVTAKNVATGSTRRTTAGADGSYSIIGLSPGTYSVDAGAGTEKTVTLTVASTATLNLTPEAAAASTANAADATSLQGVTVAATTMTEVKTPEVGQTISLHQIATIPQASRNFLEFADTVPGMVFNIDAKGNTSLRGGAQNDSSTNVYIDGVGQKSYVKEGGVSGQNASQGNPFPQLAIGEYKVITSNYKAEYDQVSSAAITAETKSGTNEFHGEVFGTYTNDAFRAPTATEEFTRKKTPSSSKEYGFAVGGPIMKDKMHFFLAYEEKKFDTPISVVPNPVNNANVTALLPQDVQSQLGSSNLPFNEKLYFGKIDWELTDRDRIEVSTQVRRETQRQGIGSGLTASAGVDNKNHDTRATFKWQHSGDSWFNELMFSYENAFVKPTPINDTNGFNYTYQPQQDALIISTGSSDPRATQNKAQEGPTISDTFTFNDLQWQGDHVVKLGYKFKSIELTAQDAAANNPQFFYDVNPGVGASTTPWKVFYAQNLPGQTGIAQTTSRQYGLFAQDDWAVNDHLTLNLGVRWDYEVTPSYLNYVTPQRVIDALNSQDPYAGAPAGQTYAESLAKGGVNVNDYISTGNNRKAFRGEWQPRLGFSYDLFADEAHVIHGGAGRAYDRNLYDYLQVEQTKLSLPQTTLFFNTPGHPCDTGASNCIPWNPAYLGGQQVLQGLFQGGNSGQEVDMLNNKLKAPYSDQFSLGMSNTVGEWLTDATVTRVLTRDGFVFTLGNRYPNGSFFNASGSQPWGNGVPNLGGLIIGNNGIATRTTQVLLSAQKPYTKDSGWSTSLAYTYSHAKQNRAIAEHYSFDEASINDYPFITSDAVAKHRFVATGTMDLPWGISGSLKLTLATPLPKNDIACYGAIDPNTGSACLPVSATPHGSKFLVGGDIWGYRDIDLQLTKDFVIDQDTKLYARFDILNVFNWHNYSDYLTNWGSNGVLNTNGAQYNTVGNITYLPRTARFTVGLKF
ncbi:outer membrane receptor for ferrienterochelin and colicin [Luteibacter sp. Sphag1AF]|uniref:TonB-dependent receptor n=1 Tax=Luteibacter sp. Sphag1AF TaxID=2587031 RepID=UPI0018318958|nr:TonB-dependent receptor [Luteibacter sp. Sphag1AF]MBB3226674.1 outer membrane receptor for ferrienterochelin and colicin [Luteibacter sp. Sphag1AF]